MSRVPPPPDGGGSPPSSAALRRGLPFVLAAVAAAAFASGLDGGFLSWDDRRLASENPRVGPPYLENTLRLFAGPQNEAYQPLATASYQIDHAVFGMDPRASRAINLLLYAVAVALLALLLLRLGASPVASALGTLVFAVHPAHAESVAWISGRKDVLSLLLALAALWLHVASRRPFDRRHLGSLGLFVAAALTKTTVLFLPLWLPVLDRTLLGRSRGEALRRAVPALVPALVLGGLVTWIWHAEGLTRTLAAEANRFALAPKVFLHYLETTFWPIRLSPLYPIDRVGAADGRTLAGLALLAAAVVFLVRRRRVAPWAAAGGSLFLLALLPVSNLVPMTFQVNDRYLLLPTLGLAFLVPAGERALSGSRPLVRRGAVVVLLAVAAGAAVLAFLYAGRWTSDRALWEQAVRAQPRSYYAWMKLGEVHREAGRYRQAEAAYLRAVALEPELLPARGGRLLACLAEAQARRGGDAAEPFERLEARAGAVLRVWGDAVAMFDQGLRLYADGFDPCAQQVILQAAEVRPPLDDARLLGTARDWLDAGRPGYARELLDRVSPPGRRGAEWERLRRRAAPPGPDPPPEP